MLLEIKPASVLIDSVTLVLLKYFGQGLKKNYESKVWNYTGFGRHYPIDMKGIYNNQNILKEANM